jgi:hypothetical protein
MRLRSTDRPARGDVTRPSQAVDEGEHARAAGVAYALDDHAGARRRG